MTTYTPLQLLPLPPTAVDPNPVPTALTIDPYSDLLWVGSSSGHVSALCSPLSLTRNVQFPAHGAKAAGAFLTHAANMSVKEIRVTDRDVWTLTDGGVGGRRRGGAVKWSISDPTRSLASMSPNPANSNEVVAGGNGLMLGNTSTGQIVRRVDLPSPVVHLASQERGIVSAALSGSVSILDPRTGFKAGGSSVQAHTGGLSGAEVQTNLICTWGWTHSQGHPLPDPLVRLYDVRTLRPLPPISFPAGPGFVRLHPSDPSKLVIASQQGMLQTVDMSQGSDSSTFTQLDVTSYITSMALSNFGDYLAFGDGDGQLHLWTSHDTGDQARDESGRLKLPPFHYEGGVSPEWPDEPVEQKTFALEDRQPLNAIGMPNHREDQLLSNISKEDFVHVTSPFFNPPEPIPASVLTTMKMVDFVGYATMPRELKGHRNLVKAGPGAAKRMGGEYARRESAPRFRSDKDRDKANVAAELEAETSNGMPRYYKKVEIKYSKFGVEDFDFDFYNQTEYSGLETDILNSYTNALLQALHYTTPIRAVAKAHICADCTKDHCLLCETGFLFRMLEDAKGVNCQASNFSRAFSATPQASALGLMDDNKNKSTSPYGSLIQNFNRWLMSTISAEAVIEGVSVDIRTHDISNLSLAETPSIIDQVLGIETVTTNTCVSCRHVTTREATLTTIDLAYPKKGSDAPSFADLVTSSISRESQTRATCKKCKQFAPLDTQRLLAHQRLPPVLSLNALVASPEIFEVWRDQRDEQYLPRSIWLELNQDGTVKASSDNTGIEYAVKAMVVQVQDAPDAPAHLVSFAKTDEKWVLFNDFVVREVSEDEVFRFPDAWKTPAVVILERVDAAQVLDLGKLPTRLQPDVLYKDVSMAWNRRNHLVKHKTLTPDELPQPGTLVAIDAEFVALQQEEMEFRSDGTKSILRPSHMSLARVSVLRENEVPFIDDYILTSETVADYLTEFSGIKNGDLDRNNSPHTLVPLKVAYKKLRALVDLGCVFIGHGLAKDFRTINIYVPPAQVLDTVNLYTSEDHKRKLSLRFLSWFLLKKDIQTASHDSIEDARYALLLYKLWKDFKRDDRLGDVMDDIFFEGHKLGFKPPQDRDAISSPAMSPAPKRVPVSTGSPAPLRTPRQQHTPRGRRK